MKVLVTGASGFVGGYLVRYLQSLNVKVIPTVRVNSEKFKDYIEMDVMDKQRIKEVITEYRPTHIVHLAGQSSVSESWNKKEETFALNVFGTLRLLDAIREAKLNCRILTIGSSEEYGLVNPIESPVKETNPLRPMSPYGVSKLSAGIISMQYAKAYQMDIIHTRTFNHIGPGQRLGFVTQDFAKQIVDIEKRLKEPVLRVGNLEAIRDFTDVRDIVRAYVALLQKGKRAEVYNVCSGQGVTIKNLLDHMLVMSKVSIRVEVDTAKLRPSDVPVLVGDCSKISLDTGWKKEIPLSDSLHDILNYYREK